MKKTLLLTLGILLACISVYAQPRHTHNPKFFKEVFEFKLKYLAQEMDLKSDQREKFVELYKKMWDEKHALFVEVQKLEKSVKDNKNATDEDFQKVSEAITQAKSKDAEIERKYDEQFATFLTPKQIFKMKNAEESFREKMQKMRHQNKGDQKHGERKGKS